VQTITTGDCIEQLTAMPAGSVNLVVADPPYNIGIDYGNGEKADRLPAADYIEWTRRWIEAAARALVPDGSMWVICGQEYGAHHDLAMQAAGLTMRSRITWYETFGTNCRKKFNRTSRPVFYAVKHPSRFTFNAAAVTVPSARQLKYGDKRAATGGKIMDDVWSIPRVCGTFKERVKGVPTQLPVELVSRIVLCSSNPGELVVDLFAGSGTTGVVTAIHDRRFHGIELRKKFAALARQRIAGVQQLQRPAG
jgi:DNA modification methylase